jgi:hypothetical protein
VIKKPDIPEENKLAYGILKRVYRRMQMRGVRIMQVARKGKRNSTLLYRAYTWEEACRMIEVEMGALECQTKKINPT